MKLPKILYCLLYINILQNVVKCEKFLNETDESPFETRCSRKCQNTVNKDAAENIFLFVCSCSPSCAIYKDCCYDSKYRNETAWDETDFICLSVVKRGQYKAISGCPADQVSNACKDGIGHLPPVTSISTNTTYANIFCAICNNDAQILKHWNVELRCNGNEKELSDNDSTKILYQLGYFWKFSELTGSKILCMYHVHFDDFSLIDSLELRFCESMKKTSVCSPMWTDLQIIDLCKSYEDPIYFGSRLFRNLHCAECNFMNPKYAQCLPFSMEVMLQMELKHPLGTEFSSKLTNAFGQAILDKGRPYSFSSLFNIKKVECMPKHGQRCCPGERYDFRSKQCRNILRS